MLRLRPVVTPALLEALPPLLADAPDPDSAILGFERLVTDSSSEILGLLERNSSLAHYAIVIFGHSRFLGETLLQNPEILQTFLRSGTLDRSLSREAFHESYARFRSRSFETDVAQLLARFKKREYVRILLRDALHIAPLAETTAEISALADVLIEEALHEAERELRQRQDRPQHVDSLGRIADTSFSILALGKLGGNELNYSSDVDLMYIFGDGSEPPGAKATNREYFVRLAQSITGILSRTTKEGAVFRIDLRLRPRGNEGELAISLTQAARYYASVAQDWERQALIKVRYSAGNVDLAREFIREIQPYVYVHEAPPSRSAGSGTSREESASRATPATPLNFEAIKTALEARERIAHHRDRRLSLNHSADAVDVKVGRGGIRDIEFLVQCLQRVYGGAEPWLRSGGTLFSLQKLNDKRHISSREFHLLTGAYEFLRHLEHRLQLREGRQTHRLPASMVEMRIIERAMAGRFPGGVTAGDLSEVVSTQMSAVEEIYESIVHHQRIREQQGSTETLGLQGTAEVGFAEQSSQQILSRLAVDAPEIYKLATRGNLSQQVRAKLYRYLSAAFTSSERYSEVVRNATAMPFVLRLFEASDLLTDTLLRHPDEIATLSQLGALDRRSGSPYLFDLPFPGSASLVDPIFAYVVSSQASYGEKLSLLRQHYRHRVFAAAARDVSELRDIYESLGSTTAGAEDAISAAYGIAGEPSGLAVMALGRLGTREFDLLSDADLLFVCDEQAGRNSVTKGAEQMMHALAAYTRDGMVFPVDARLRPRGNSGELVVSPTQLLAYFEREAEPWEALSFTKLRFLVGAHDLEKRVLAVTQTLFRRFASEPGFLASLTAMRTKLETMDGGGVSLKNSAGAIYDVDFLTGYLLIKHSLPNKGGTLRDRLWRCAASGLINKSDAAVLDHATELLRTVEHVVRLVVGRPSKWLPSTEYAYRMTEKLASQILRRDFSDGLEAELQRSCSQVRAIYMRVFSASEMQ
ncbi:MAG TPA: hypothetical protein VH437_14945 [Terriglobales bacterium]|jgi:glutamate-ammonia-ligase adenylyltransferase